MATDKIFGTSNAGDTDPEVDKIDVLYSSDRSSDQSETEQNLNEEERSLMNDIDNVLMEVNQIPTTVMESSYGYTEEPDVPYRFPELAAIVLSLCEQNEDLKKPLQVLMEAFEKRYDNDLAHLLKNDTIVHNRLTELQQKLLEKEGDDMKRTEMAKLQEENCTLKAKIVQLNAKCTEMEKKMQANSSPDATPRRRRGDGDLSIEPTDGSAALSVMKKQLHSSNQKLCQTRFDHQLAMQTLQSENQSLRHESCQLRERCLELEKELRASKEHPSKKELREMREHVENSEHSHRDIMLAMERIRAEDHAIKLRLNLHDYYNFMWANVFTNSENKKPPDQEICENLKLFKDSLNALEDSSITDIEKLDGLEGMLDCSELDVEIDEKQDVAELKKEIRTLRKNLIRQKLLHSKKGELVSKMKSHFDVIHKNCLYVLKGYKPKTASSQQEQIVPAKEKAMDSKALEEEIQRLKTELHARDDLVRQKESEIAALREGCKEHEKQSEEMILLKDQMRIYEEDFNMEREAKQSVTLEKTVLNQEVLNLRQRNQELLRKLQQLENSTQFVNSQLYYSGEGSNSSRELSNKSRAKPPPLQKTFTCIMENCDKVFNTSEELEDHVNECLGQ